MFLTLPVFAEYKPIPKELSKQYKAEIEQIIDEEYPNVIKKIDNYIFEGKKYYDNIKKNGYNYEDEINLTNLSEIYVSSAEIDLYSDIMRITQEKYLGIGYKPFPTDSIYPFDEYLKPYFIDNNINKNKLIKISIYKKNKNKILQRYLKYIHKIYFISS